jgi:GxxExxY protein
MQWRARYGVPVCYKGEEISRQRIDMVVDERLIIEAKSTQDLHKSASRQVHNYLCATRLRVGLLLHFGPEPAFYRLVHTQATPTSPRKGVTD